MQIGLRPLAVIFGLTSALLFACTESDDSSDVRQTRSIMREIFNGIRVLLPASVEPEEFSDPAMRPKLSAAFDILSRNAQMLEEHTQSKDGQMHFLARSVARDASDAQRSFEERRYERSAFVLRQIAENCVVCHTRLPDLDDSPVAEGFVDQGVMESLPLEPRATLQIATRRFDEALASLRELLLDPAEPPAVMLGPLTDYLVVSIRVKGDFDKPASLLEAFGARDDLWPSLKRDVQHWIEVLPELRQKASGTPDVATGRAIIDEAVSNDPDGDGQTGLLNFVVASSILERFIASHRERDATLGEAFFLLGTLEARIGRNYWVTPAPFLLAESIRISPGEPFAVDAIDILERELNAEYEGSDFEQLPEDDQRQINELRALIDGAAG